VTKCTWCQTSHAPGVSICRVCGRPLPTGAANDRPLLREGGASTEGRSARLSWWNGGPFLLLGAAWIALGAVFWLHDRLGVDLWVAGVGVLVVLVGVGFRLGSNRVFRAP